MATSKRNVRICKCCQYASNNHLPHLKKPLLSFFQPLTQTGPAVASPGLWPASLLRFSNDPWHFDTEGSPRGHFVAKFVELWKRCSWGRVETAFHWMLVRKITQLSNKVHLKVMQIERTSELWTNRSRNEDSTLLVHRKCKMHKR